MTKICSIFDVGSTGLPVDMEMYLADSTLKALRKAFGKRLQRQQGETKLMLVSGNIHSGNAKLVFKFERFYGDKESMITYELIEKNGTGFLNVMCNPTVLMAGDNSLPVLLKGRTPFETFKIMNRLPYSLLEEILNEEGFVWRGTDKQRLKDGDLNLKQLQIAFYSGDLGGQRPEVMRFLRTIYGGLDSTVDKTFNLAEGLNLQVECYDKNDNMRISSRTGNNNLFSLVMYHKDRISNSDAVIERVKNLIRYDCTFHSQFLVNNRINKISLLEDKYLSLCTGDKGDKKFVFWLRNKILSRIKLKYIMSLDRATYFNNLKRAEAEFEGDYNSVNAKVFWCWRRDQNFESQKEMGEALGVTRSAISKAFKYLEETYGFDLEISRSYLEAMFFNSALAMISSEERGVAASTYDGDNREIPSFSELHKRSAKRLARVRKAIKEQGGLLNVRRMTPVIVSEEKLYVHKCMGMMSEHVWERVA